MRQRHPRVGRRGDRGGDPGYDGEPDAGLGERERLLAAPAEDEGIAALQPDDRLPVPGRRRERLVDELLEGTGGPGLLAHVHQVGGGREFQQFRRDQPVVDDDVGAPEEFGTLERDEPGIPGARADEVDHARHQGDASGGVPAPWSSRPRYAARPRTSGSETGPVTSIR